MLKKIENGLMALLVVLALFLICKEVVVRYFVPQYLTDYGLEFTIYFTVWAIFLGGAPLVREGRHVRADILLHLLPPPAQRILEILSLLIGLVFTCVLAYYGWLMVQIPSRSASGARARPISRSSSITWRCPSG